MEFLNILYFATPCKGQVKVKAFCFSRKVAIYAENRLKYKWW